MSHKIWIGFTVEEADFVASKDKKHDRLGYRVLAARSADRTA
ncbi:MULTISPECIES: hypothetical protein [Amycolatopsis]|nr:MULTISPECIES: hypothetical protein [Amycolatopsis]